MYGTNGTDTKSLFCTNLTNNTNLSLCTELTELTWKAFFCTNLTNNTNCSLCTEPTELTWKIASSPP